jgi:hypothetical protein
MVLGLMAIKYRCNLLDMDRIASMHVVEADDDAAALLEVDRILAASPCTAVEIWDRSRKVAILGRRQTAA